MFLLYYYLSTIKCVQYITHSVRHTWGVMCDECCEFIPSFSSSHGSKIIYSIIGLFHKRWNFFDQIMDWTLLLMQLNFAEFRKKLRLESVLNVDGKDTLFCFHKGILENVFFMFTKLLNHEKIERTLRRFLDVRFNTSIHSFIIAHHHRWLRSFATHFTLSQHTQTLHCWNITRFGCWKLKYF